MSLRRVSLVCSCRVVRKTLQWRVVKSLFPLRREDIEKLTNDVKMFSILLNTRWVISWGSSVTVAFLATFQVDPFLCFWLKNQPLYGLL